MALLDLIFRRLRAQRVLAVAQLAAMAFAIGVVVAGPIYAEGSARAVVGGVVARSPSQEANVRYQVATSLMLPPDTGEKVAKVVRDLPVKRVIEQTRIGHAVAGFIFTVTPVYRAGAAANLLVPRGRFPTAPAEAAVESDNGAFLGVDLGTPLVLRSSSGSISLRVSANYDVLNAGTAYWLGTRSIFVEGRETQLSPSEPAQGEPVFVTKEGAERIADRLHLGRTYSWDVYLNLQGLTLGEVSDVRARAEGSVLQALAALPGMQYLQAQSGLAAVEERVARAVGSATSPIYLVVLQIAAVALGVLAGVGLLALARRSFELAVLKSRGWARWQLLVAQGLEAGLLAVLAFVPGLAIGLLLAQIARRAHGPYVPGTLFPIRVTSGTMVIAAVAALVAAVFLTVIAVPQVSRTVIEERRRASREERPFISRWPLEILFGMLGLAAFWEVHRRGLGASIAGREIDPLALLAPTLLLLAAALLALRILLWAFRRLDRPIGRIRRVTPYLAGRRLVRAPGASSATALLLLLATGLLVISSSIRASVLSAYQREARQRVGANWRLTVEPPAQGLEALNRLPPQSTGISMVGGLLISGAQAATVVGIDPGTFASGAWVDPTDPSPAQAFGRLRAPPVGAALPAGTTALTLTIDAHAPPPGLTLAAVVLERSGRTAAVAFGPLSIGRVSRTATAPAGSSRLLSIVVERPHAAQAPPSISMALELKAVAAGRQVPIDLGDWVSMPYRNAGGTTAPDGVRGVRTVIRPGIDAVVGGVIPPIAPIPVLTSPNVDIGTGTPSAVIGGQVIPFSIKGTVTGIPGLPFGSDDIVVVPERTVMALVQSAPAATGLMRQVRTMAASDPRPALAAAGLHVAETTSARSIEASLALEPQSLAIGMHYAATLGGVALAVIGLAAAMYFGQRRREFEFAALRAMGAGRGKMVGSLALEQALLVGFAIAVAVGLGWWLLRLIAPYVTPTVSARVQLPGLRLDAGTLAVLVGTTVAAAAVGLGLAVRDLLRASVTGTLRQEVE